MNVQHPHVSEESEGSPVAEWVVFAVVSVAAVVAWLGHTMAATIILALTALVTGTLRLVLKDRSPWKVRSIGFDVFISYALGFGLLVTYISIEMMM